jgi:hypothetical protein
MKRTNYSVLAIAIVFTFLSGGALADCKEGKDNNPSHNKDVRLKCNSLSGNEKKICPKGSEEGTKKKYHTREVLQILI